MANLVEKCAIKIVDWCFHDDTKASNEQREILVYGYTLFLENVYKTILLLLIALLTETFWETLLIIGSFGLLRCFSGGIHCHSSLGCTLGMIGVWIVGLAVSRIELPLILLIMMGIVVIWTILRYAPRATENNPIQTKKVWKQRRIGSILVMALLLTAGIVCALFLNRPEILNMILTSLYIEAFSILLLAEKEEMDNEDFEESCHQAW
ncbi:MAG: accessory gene regulator B family protein [Bacteroides sp.]|nr:accessory gene regulator B family protein [Bacteroides sp.]MCM1551007.1 accessory gene regulator B family protein [Clostridium sp.]